MGRPVGLGMETRLTAGQKSAAARRHFHTKFPQKQHFFAFLQAFCHRKEFVNFWLPGAELALTSGPMIKKFIGYYRVSTKQQGLDGNGMTAQREIVRRFAEGQHGVLEKEFSEVESGKWTDDERPQLAAALDYAKKIKGVLVIAKLDRLARNAEFLLRLQNSGVDFVCCDCPNADKFTVGILALVAQRERELISERTRLGLAAAKTKGVKLGTPNPQKAVAAMVTANKSAKTEFVNKVRPIIEEIKSAGVQTLQGISDCLNRRGIPTRSGKTWYPSTVRNVINGGGL
jgi:DNA invertase Pin-like site-specific DNA recombinase